MRALPASNIGAGVFAELAPSLEARRAAGGDLIQLHIGDTHRAPYEGSRFSAVDDVGGHAALYGYGAVDGLGELKAAFAARLATRSFGPPGVDPHSGILVASGATHAMFCAARALFEPGDEVVVAAPYWPLSVGVLRAAGAVPVELALTTRLAADPALDVESLLATALTGRTRAVYFGSPGNPDGKVLTEGQLAQIARFARAHDLWVMADEVYAEHVFAGAAHVSIARLEGMAERTVSLYSMSKSHGLAGARVGFAVASPSVIARARAIATHTVFNVPVASQRVALRALGAPESWMREMRDDYAHARDVAIRGLRALGEGVRFAVPEGGAYVFVDFGGALDKRPLLDLLQGAVAEGVLLTPGRAFGEGFEAWARLCFTSEPADRLAEGIVRLGRALAKRDQI